MKKITLLCALFVAQLGFSQIDVDYKSAASNPEGDYFKVVAETREHLLAKYAEDDSRKNLKALKQFERWAYNWKNKVNADGTFPSSVTGWNSYLDVKKESNNSQARNSQSSRLIDGNWVPAGTSVNVDVNGTGRALGLGRISTIAIHPTNDLIIYVGAATGGVWKTIDGGTTWTPKTDNLAGLGVTQITINTDNTDIIYMATGDYDGGDMTAQDMYQSIDAGETWTSMGLAAYIPSLNLSVNALIGDLDFNPTSGGFSALLGVSFESNYLIYEVNTSTWSSRSFFEADGTTALVNPPNRLGEIEQFAVSSQYIAMSDQTGRIFFSSDFGQSFKLAVVDPDAPAGQSHLTANKLTLSAFPNIFGAGNFLMGAYYTSGRFRVYNITQNATTMALELGAVKDLALGAAINAQGGYNLAMIQPNNAAEVIITGVNGFRLDWNAAAPSLTNVLDGYDQYTGADNFRIHADHHVLVMGNDGTTVYNGNDGGIFKGDYNATSANPWENITNGLTITQSHNVAISQSNEDILMLANQDNDGFVRTRPAGSTGAYEWKMAVVGDGAGCAIDYNDPNNLYMGSQFGALRASSVGYNSSAFFPLLAADAVNTAFISPLVIHPTDPTILYRGYGDVTRLNIPNGVAGAGKTTTSLGSGLTRNSFLELGKNGSNPLAIYAIGDNGAKKSLNEGAVWTTLTSPSAQPFTSFSVKSSTLASGNETVYATVSGYVAGEKVYKSTDGGASWTGISAGLPNVIVKQVVAHQTGANNPLFLATELGVYYKDDSTANWTILGTALPNVRVEDLKFNYTTNTLYAATFGRGLWKVNLNVLNTESNTLQATSIKVYPNPVNSGDLKLELPSTLLNDDTTYTIYNYLGAIIKEATPVSATKSAINVNSLASGVYLLQVKTGKDSFVTKFVKN